MFLHKSTTKKVIDCFINYISQYDILKQYGSDPGAVFTSAKFEKFFRDFQIKHITCLVRDHQGNGIVEQLTRSISEPLKTNKSIIICAMRQIRVVRNIIGAKKRAKSG